MPISLTCPSCAAKLRAPDNLAGRKVKCPKCGNPVGVKFIKEKDVPSVEEIRVSKHELLVAKEPIAQAVPQTPFDDIDQDDYEPIVSRARRTPKEPGAAHSLGIASLCLGVVSLAFSLIPCAGMLSLPLSCLGLLLGIVGGLVALFRSGHGIGFPIAGFGMNLMAVLIGLFWLGAMHTGFQAVDDLAKKRESTNQTVSFESSKENSPSENKPNPSKSHISPDWPDASKAAVQQGSVRVRVVSVRIDFVKGKDFREFTSKEKLLQIGLQIENLHANQKIDFTGWGSSLAGFVQDDTPRLKDNFDNYYKRVNFGLGALIEGQATSESIYPGKSVTDLLVFEVPVENIKYLRLELPARNFGGTGQLRFQIPKSMLETK